MLSRDQFYIMLLLRNREDNIFSVLPYELILDIYDFGQDPKSEFARALGLARSGVEEDIAALVEMVKVNPSLLLQAGNVVTRGGVPVIRTTLYEFFLGEGDPAGAKRIEFGFALIPDGENERIRQYERYRPHIEALAKQIEEKKPAYDLRPLFDIIKKSSLADVAEALNINDPNREVTRNTPLRIEFAKFRRAVQPKRKAVGMHYEHYTTLQQAFDLLYSELKELSHNYTNYEKCYLICRQIIGYLQLKGLPAVDRFPFARAFEDEKRTLKFKYVDGVFPDCSAGVDLLLSGLGFAEMIFGGVAAGRSGWRAFRGLLENTCRAKISGLQNLCRSSPSRSIRPGE